jgi:3-hydroxymyristoyl/3-hydroxydecanoyl-(acyl carrier protein) dehydratase
MIDPAKIFDFGTPERAGAGAHVDWTVPADCPYLEGHFPGMPVFPAVGLLDGSLELLRRCGRELHGTKLTLKKAKFSGVVAPGMSVRVSLVHKENRTEIEWRNRETNEPLATFTL